MPTINYSGLSLTALAFGWASSVHSFAPSRSIEHSHHHSTAGRRPCHFVPPRLAERGPLEMATLATDNVAQEWDADLYQQNHSFVWKHGSSLVDLVFTDLPVSNRCRILDIGCGTGELTEQLYQRADAQATVIGMDADPNMIRRATEQFVRDGKGDSKKKLDFFVGDACNFQREEPVDVVFSNAALHWVGRNGAARAIECMSDALVPNGRFVLEFGGKGNVETIVTSILEVMDLPRQAADFWWYPSIGELATLMEQHGLEVTQAQLFDRPTDLVGEQGLHTWLKMFANKFFDGLESGDVENIIDRVVDQCRPSLYHDGVWKADYRRIRVVGQKKIQREI
ncbi:hypothetical protein MPSEU_000015800 [Mayamaea pseudoterrestris]|nr:hypothetical protein MPSEU_000015800 [Mayamaea pseudoterrestris]